MEKLSLIIPDKTDLWFKKQMKEDPATMDYNAGYNVNYFGYDYNTGTIKTDAKELETVWYKRWINNFPQRIYFYVKKSADNTFVGEVCASYDEDKDSYEISIIIKGEYRGKGYSSVAIKLLIDELKKRGAKKLYHEVPSSRVKAIKADLNNGFKVVKSGYNGIYLKFGKKEQMTFLELCL